MQEYEIAVLYDQGLEVDLSKAEERVKKIVTDNGGKITSEDNWGKKKLAYPINKAEYAIYVFYTADLKSESLEKIEGLLNITNEVVRYLIVKVDQKAKAKAEEARKEKAKKDDKKPKDKTKE